VKKNILSETNTFHIPYKGSKKHTIVLTIHIRDSKLAPRFTDVKIAFSGLYANFISLIVRTGGFSGSTSGNLMVTSNSFSTGFNSGLKKLVEVNVYE
jgi:hypothetical protein